MTNIRGKCITQLLLLGAIDSIQVWILCKCFFMFYLPLIFWAIFWIFAVQYIYNKNLSVRRALPVVQIVITSIRSHLVAEGKRRKVSWCIIESYEFWDTIFFSNHNMFLKAEEVLEQVKTTTEDCYNGRSIVGIRVCCFI